MFGYQWTWTMVLLYRLYIKNASSDPIYNCENIQIFINNLAPFLTERTLNVNPCRAQPMQPSWGTGVLSPTLFKAKLRLCRARYCLLILSVCRLSVCLSVCMSNASIVSKRTDFYRLDGASFCFSNHVVVIKCRGERLSVGVKYTQGGKILSTFYLSWSCSFMGLLQSLRRLQSE